MRKPVGPSMVFSFVYAIVTLWMAYTLFGWRGAVLAFALLGYIRAELVRARREDDE